MFCRFCNKVQTNKGGLGAHEKHCVKNPSRVQGSRSPNAGAQKGSVPWNKGQKVGPPKDYELKFSLDQVMVENSTYGRTNLRRRLIANGLVPYTCACCGLGPEWQGKSMPLVLDHINGVNNDNRLENLRFVCSNCDSQLDTYKARNKRKKHG
jgi:hypothetical protein